MQPASAGATSTPGEAAGSRWPATKAGSSSKQPLAPGRVFVGVVQTVSQTPFVPDQLSPVTAWLP